MATKKKAAKPNRPRDVNQLAHSLINEMTERLEAGSTAPKVTSEISKYMSALGRRGGKVGGVSRAESLTPARRKQIAARAAAKRWEGHEKPEARG